MLLDAINKRKRPLMDSGAHPGTLEVDGRSRMGSLNNEQRLGPKSHNALQDVSSRGPRGLCALLPFVLRWRLVDGMR